MQLEILPLDPADEPTVTAVQALQEAACAVDTPDFPPPCVQEFRAELAHQGPGRRNERYVARRGGDVVGYLVLSLPLLDNLANADTGLSVHPAHRRTGVGRALHTAAVARTRELGRTRLTGESVESLPGGSARSDVGRAFAAAMGAKEALHEVRRRLDLTGVDEAAQATLLAEARAKAGDYQLVRWHNQTPEQYAVDTGYLEGRLNTDAPVGELVLEEEKVDVARLRSREQLHLAAGMQVYSTGAVHTASARLVALTTLARMASSPWHAWQWITLVDPDHRGYRLGALVKIENMRYARAHESQLQVVDTWNAAVNSHMIKINEAMGFRPVDSWIMWQQDL